MLSTRPARRQFLALAGVAATTVSCGSALGGGLKPTSTLRYQGWAGTVTPAELAEDLGYLKQVRLEWVGNTISGPQDIQTAATGEVDFGGAFNGAIVNMAAAKAPVKAVISYYGVDSERFSGFYVLRDSPLTRPRDLIGKKVGMNTLGGHSEAVLDIYLRRHGLTPAEIEQVERIALPPVNTEQALRRGQLDVAVLTDIMRDKALERGGIRALFNDHALMGAFSAGSYVMAQRFLDVNPKTARTFVTGVARALEWSRSRPREEVVDRMERIVRRRKRNEDIAPIRYWRSYGTDGPGGRIAAKEMSLWADLLAERGDIERDRVEVKDIYTNAYNTYRARSRAR